MWQLAIFACSETGCLIEYRRGIGGRSYRIADVHMQTRRTAGMHVFMSFVSVIHAFLGVVWCQNLKRLD